MLNDEDLKFLRHAIELAKMAEEDENLPIGAVIVLDGHIIGSGKNSIRRPRRRPNRHAEIEALESVEDPDSWDRSAEMTLYTTLEPCLMCLGAILVHRIGRIVYGSNDYHGGAGNVFRHHMPYAFKKIGKSIKWTGPALPEECDKLRDTVIKKVNPNGDRDFSILDFWEPNFDPTVLKRTSSKNQKN